VEAGSKTSIVALRVVGGEEMGNRVPGVTTGPPSSQGIYTRGPGPPGLGILESETIKYMVMSPAGLRPDNYCAGEAQQQL
jgi:hypothetical protein